LLFSARSPTRLQKCRGGFTPPSSSFFRFSPPSAYLFVASFPLLKNDLSSHHRLQYLGLQKFLRLRLRDVLRQHDEIRVLPRLQLALLPVLELRVRRPARVPPHAIAQRNLLLWLPASRRAAFRQLPRHARIQSAKRINRLHVVIRSKR